MREPPWRIRQARWLPLIGMMIAIFAVSSQPGDNLPLPDIWNLDKLCHLLEYGILAATTLYALHPIPSRSRTMVAVGVVCFSALYGVSDEFHQSFVPLRTCHVSDVLADTLGAALLTGAWWWRAAKGAR